MRERGIMKDREAARQSQTPLANLGNEELIRLLRESAPGSESTFDPGEVREEIVKRNVGLVKSIALKFVHSGEPLDDLIQAGYIGLLNAVTNFDLAKETRFSTYATYLIRGEIRHFIRDKHSTIRIPQWVQTMNRRIKQVEEEVFQASGRPPTLGEIAEKLVAQSTITTGSSRLFAHLLTTESDTSQIFMEPVDAERAGRTYRDLAREVIRSGEPRVLVGFILGPHEDTEEERSDPLVVLNPRPRKEPGRDTVLDEGDRLIVIAF